MVTRFRPKVVKSRVPKIRVVDVEDRWNRNIEDEALWWPRVLWIDPGGVSGVAVIWFDPQAVLRGEPMARTVLAYSETYLSGPEKGMNGQVNRFMRMHNSLNREVGLATGIESFIPRKMSQDPAFLSPVRIRAAIEDRMAMKHPPLELHTQSPSDALTTFNNDRLRALNLYTQGPDHINDAKRHALLWVRKLRPLGREGIERFHGEEKDWWV